MNIHFTGVATVELVDGSARPLDGARRTEMSCTPLVGPRSWQGRRGDPCGEVLPSLSQSGDSVGLRRNRSGKPTVSETLGGDMDRMLILRGISGTFPDPATGVLRRWAHGALDEPSAIAYAQLKGYDGQVLQVSGETGLGSPQTRATLAAFRSDPSVAALYGFSGGGYNVRWVLQSLTPEERRRIRLVVVLGAPKNDPSLYRGAWQLVYRLDPPQGHMAGPRALLDSAR